MKRFLIPLVLISSLLITASCSSARSVSTPEITTKHTTSRVTTVEEDYHESEEEYPDRLELTIENAYSRTDGVTVSQTDNFAKDGFGHTYDRIGIFSDSGGSDDKPQSATFYVSEKYKELSATIYVPYCSLNTKEPQYPPYVRIYGDDDTILYELKTFNGTMQPIDIKIDITGQKFIKIEIDGGWYVGDGSGRMPCFCVTNVVVKK